MKKEKEDEGCKYKYVATQDFVYLKYKTVGIGFSKGQEISEEDVPNISVYLIEKIEIQQEDN